MDQRKRLNPVEDHAPARRGTRSATALRRRSPHIVVRRATLDDLSPVVALRLALLREEERNPFFARPHPDAGDRALQLTRAELTTPGEVFLVAIRGASIVGMLRCRSARRMPLVAEARQAVVTTVYVVPEQRRSGVLRALLGGADRWCRRQGLTGMRLQCALTNDVGRKAWESLGFEPAETLYLRRIPAD
jgi:ribosomal protein S18 acetylase RimI-like enzyme